MNSHQQTDIDSGAADSVASTPRSDNFRMQDGAFAQQPHVRFMCSFGGSILPRPHDNQLRYVGGDTRIVAMSRHTTFASLHGKLAKLSGRTSMNIKYQLPSEDLDALITVTTDEDVENMMDEYERLTQGLPSRNARLRLFLFDADSDSRASSISSLLDGSTRRENWFLDALNGGRGPGSISGLERGKSEVSSIVSEVPDYLFGLDTSDDPPRDLRPKTRNQLGENNPYSDPSSPARVVSSPFCSTSSSLAPLLTSSIPDLPPVKTKPINPAPIVEQRETQFDSPIIPGEQSIHQQPGYTATPVTPILHYVQGPNHSGQPIQSIPFYYVPTPVPTGNIPIQTVPIRAPYFQAYPPPPGQIPVGYSQPLPNKGQVCGGEGKPTGAVDSYEMSGRAIPDGINQPIYYGISNGGTAPSYQGMFKQSGDDTGRVP